VGSSPDEVNFFFNLPNRSGSTRPEVHSASNKMSTRKRKIMFLGSKVRPVHRADNFATICEPIF
jgi:hypothetical protein